MYDQPQPNYTTQPNYPAPAHIVGNHRQVDWRMTGAYIIAAFALGVALVSLWLLSASKTSFNAQMTQMRHTLATVQSAQSKTADNLKGVSAEISSAQGELSLLAPYNSVCSQYLTGPNGGPDTFLFLCAEKKAGS